VVFLAVGACVLPWLVVLVLCFLLFAARLGLLGFLVFTFVRVLPMFVGLKGQFVDPVKDLLLRCGPCRVACFCHGGVV
jgi:hypothetical protein